MKFLISNCYDWKRCLVPVGCEELNSLLGDWPEDGIITQTDKRIKAVMDSGFYAVDSLPVELGIRIPIVRGILYSLKRIPKSTIFKLGVQEATSNNFPDSGIGGSGGNSGCSRCLSFLRKANVTCKSFSKCGQPDMLHIPLTRSFLKRQ